jgi:predicted RNase H-like HicB family nuclease
MGMGHRFVYEAIIEQGAESGYYVHFPDLPDAFTQGADLKQAVLNAAEVLELTLADYIGDGLEPPVPVFGRNQGIGTTIALVTVDVTEEDVRRMGFVASSEAAHMLGVSKGRVAQLVVRGQLESMGAGTSRLISLQSINDRLAQAPCAGRPSKQLVQA